jgi:hypothetical protein
MNGADGRVAGGSVDDMGSGIVTIDDISSSESGSTDNGGTGGSSRSTLGGSNGRSGGADRTGGGIGCCHQTDAEAAGDKRPTPQGLGAWSKLQTKEVYLETRPKVKKALGEEADAGVSAGTDEDSGAKSANHAEIETYEQSQGACDADDDCASGDDGHSGDKDGGKDGDAKAKQPKSAHCQGSGASCGAGCGAGRAGGAGEKHKNGLVEETLKMDFRPNGNHMDYIIIIIILVVCCVSQ